MPYYFLIESIRTALHRQRDSHCVTDDIVGSIVTMLRYKVKSAETDNLAEAMARRATSSVTQRIA